MRLLAYLSRSSIIGVIVSIAIVALTIAIVFYLLSLKDKNKDEEE